ncbi:MAG: bacillithiol biosynthesis cysteine-adding enzyme BshC [Candidatus Zixiibacteriota bacterium]|nr:MAG: bacillithiol biosynthesis cysteine-adding enzyme BshC [candidate division Zixibacteria bacterium]
MSNLIAPSKALGYSSIFLDFLSGSGVAKDFYPATDPADVARRLDAVAYRRDHIVAILEKQNSLYGASDKTLANIEKLKDPLAVCLFAGQQAILFGGPMLIMYKALSLVKAAHAYTEKLGRPVIPVFWIAADDHDFEEVNHTYVLSRSSELTKICYETPPTVELPISEVRLSDSTGLDKARNTLQAALGQTDFTSDLYALIERCYTPEDTFVTAFGKFMAALTADLGLVFFSPGDPDAKRLAAPLFKDIVSRGHDLQQMLSETNLKIRDSGYHIQVEKAEDATHLFYNLDGRSPVHRQGDGYVAGEARLSRDDLMARIDEHPERFSPDVMTRPVMQSYLFPVVSQKGGAAEIAYLAQVHRIFDLFGLVTPYYRSRPTMTVIEKRFERLMTEHAITFEQLTGDIEQVINRVLTESFPDDIEDRFGEFRAELTDHFARLTTRALEFDPSLSDLAEKTKGKIDFVVKALENKVFSSHKKKSSETRERIYRLHAALYPNRNFQERSLNISYFLSKYGPGFIPYLFEAMDCREKAHQLIYLSEYEV